MNDLFDTPGGRTQTGERQTTLDQLVAEAKTDKPEPGKQYRLIGRTGEASIARGNTWAESEIE